ncbi:MAG: RNA polymerase sigma factor [Saprospirales bacterium]|nr:RNA polymerase sigma factor [Saprospirales bacterium]MBK8489683.1 RNA polymerase sigma factor [Saprospirales bacterium]
MYPTKEICKQLSDQELIRKSLQEVDYFSCLYDRYEEQLLRYIKRLGVEEEAEDVLQEAFINIWKNLYAFDQSLKLSSWLYRIVHNQVVSCIRKKKSFGKDQKDTFDEQRFADLPDESFLDTDVLEEKDRLTHELLEKLPLLYKEVMVLKFLEDMSYEEISDILKIPEGTVATRINRAKKAFRKLSEQYPIAF